MKTRVKMAAILCKSKFPPRKDVCPRCRAHFMDRKIHVLWKDVVECKRCGHIWVLICLYEFHRWN